MHHGVVTKAQLAATGMTRGQLSSLMRSGQLRRLRRGWYALPGAEAQVVRAVLAGGALTCMSALKLSGLWVPRDGRLHVRRTNFLDQEHLPQGLISCRPLRQQSVTRSVDPLILSLATAINCHDTETAVTVLDSALNKNRLLMSDLADVQATITQGKRAILDLVDPRAESGTESLTRLRLRRRNIKLRSQVEIDGVGRVDFLVGDRLVLEVDSWTYHADPATFVKDRCRDRRLAARNFCVIRLTYGDVIGGWEAAETDILTLIRARAHRWPRRAR